MIPPPALPIRSEAGASDWAWPRCPPPSRNKRSRNRNSRRRTRRCRRSIGRRRV